MSLEEQPVIPEPVAPGPAPTQPTAREALLAHPADWKWWEAIAAFIVSAIMGVFASGAVLAVMPADSGATVLVMSVVLDGFVLAGLLFWLRVGHRGWRRAINVWPSKPLEEIWAGFVRGLVVYLIAAFAIALPVSTLLELIYGAPAVTPEQLPADTTSGPNALLAIAFAALVAPIVEEFFFRGVFFRAMRAKVGFWPSAIASGVFFAIIHFDGRAPIQNALLLVLIMVFVGTAFAFIYERRGNLLAAISAHVTFNIIGLALILSGRGGA